MRKGISDWAMKRSATARRMLSKFWYQYVSNKFQDEPVVFMNLGYAHVKPGDKSLELHEEDEPNRISAQFYHHVASGIDLRGLDVLEVGCGRGGGASFVMRYHRPKSLLGIDLAKNAILFCTEHHIVDGLRFMQGNAEDLQVDDCSMDVVINIESSHCYGNMERFVSEVFRVLRPWGHLLLADHGDKARMDGVRELFLLSGFEIVKEEKINDNVIRALDLENDKRLDLIRRFAPWVSRSFSKQFAGVKGSRIYRALTSGEEIYINYVLRKVMSST